MELFFVPKFHASEYFFGSLNCLFAKIKYPLKGSRTCCQGLLNFGFLKYIDLPLNNDLIPSGINLFADQSPPPITLPALALDTPHFLLSLKKLSLYALIIISEEDFDEVVKESPWVVDAIFLMIENFNNNEEVDFGHDQNFKMNNLYSGIQDLMSKFEQFEKEQKDF